MEAGIKEYWLIEEKVLKPKIPGSAAVLWCHWQWIMSSSLKVVGSRFKSMGMMLGAGCWGLVLKPFLLTSAMLSGSFQILLNESPLPSSQLWFMDGWFLEKYFLQVPDCNNIFMMELWFRVSQYPDLLSNCSAWRHIHFLERLWCLNWDIAANCQ